MGVTQLAVVTRSVSWVVAAASVVGVGTVIGTVAWVAVVRVVVVVWVVVAGNSVWRNFVVEEGVGGGGTSLGGMVANEDLNLRLLILELYLNVRLEPLHLLLYSDGGELLYDTLNALPDFRLQIFKIFIIY